MPKWVCVVFVGKIFQCSLALLRCVVERLEFLYFLLNADHGKIILRTVPFYACKSANHGTHLVSLFVITPHDEPFWHRTHGMAPSASLGVC